jgi:5-(carboxyamino)imidazole ribonucleotide synthase
MINLIGNEVDDFRSWLAVPGACVHLSGKTAVRPGRKMGHVTRVFADENAPGAGGGSS